MDYREKIVRAFNGFNGRNLDFLDGFYSEKVVFEDPVNRIRGLESLKKYYAHAYKNVTSIRFVFSDPVIERNRVAAPWVMWLSVRGLHGGHEFSVNGLSSFVFDENDKVVEHRDYVDLGAMVYEGIPVLGRAILFIKRQLGAGAGRRV